MTDMSPALKKAVEEFKENLQETVEDGALKAHQMESRVEDLNKKMMAEQQNTLKAAAEILEDAMQWEEVPETVDNKTMAAFYYYATVEQMAESHFKGTVFQDLAKHWEAISRDQNTVQAVQKEMNEIQKGMIPLQQEQEQLAVEMQMSNPMPYPQGMPLVRMVATEADNGDWEVAMVPFMIDENLELQTENLPFEYYIGAYVKGEGISDDFNMNADVRRVGTSKPTVFKFSGDVDKDSLLFVVGHVEQQGKPVGPISMAPMPMSEYTNTKTAQEPPTPQGGNGPRLLN